MRGRIPKKRIVCRLKKGKLLTRMPSKNKITVRLTICRNSVRFGVPRESLDDNEMTVVIPMMNRNVGKTISVGVQPFQAE